MKITSRELTREFRWLTYSGTALTLGLSAAALALTGALSGAASSLSAIASFRDTLTRFTENGEDVATALDSPAIVEGDAANQVISNPLRYDLDQAALALTQLEPAGAAASVLSLCALLVFPVLGFVLGVFLSTHDITSGSVIARWPQSGIAPYAISKPVTLATCLIGVAALTGLLAVPASWVAKVLIAGEVAEIEVFVLDPPPHAQAIAIGALAVLNGIAFGALGMLVGAVTRNRTFTIALFTFAFFLLPLAGPADPRNVVTLAGADVLYFVGQFRPEPLGELSPGVAVATLGGGAILGFSLSLVPWLVTSRTRRTA